MLRRLPSALAALACLTPALAHADAIDDLAPGTWYEIPDSTMRQACPPDEPGYEYSFHCAGVVSAWSGAALDTTRGRLLVFGGGHADYKGNELYAFDLHALTWERVWGPTPDAQIPSGGTHEEYDDGNPGSRHTYSGLSYVPEPVDAFLSMGGSLWQSGFYGAGTWQFSFGSMSWTRGMDKPSDGYGDPSVYDPVTGHVWRRTNREITEYDPVADSYTDHYAEGGGFFRSDVSAALDPDARLMVIAGSGSLDEYRLDTDAYTVVALDGPTPPGLLDAAPGLAFDTALSRFVLWNGGSDVYEYDPQTKSFTQHAAAGPTPPAVVASGGTFGRFRYVPSRNVFVAMTSVDDNLFVLRMSEGSGEPLPGTGGGGGSSTGVGGSPSTGSSGGAGGAPGASPPSSNDDSGCACAAPGDRDEPSGWLAWLGALGLVVRRRCASRRS